MSIRVKVEGHGIVEFPDGTPEDEMRTALASLSAPEPKSPSTAAKEAPKASTLGTIGDYVGDVAVGAAKGVANTAIGLGDLAHRYLPGVGAVSDAAQRVVFGDVKPAGALFNAARESVQPTNTAQRIGYTGEQIGEFFVPGGAVGRAAQGSRAARAGLELVTAAPLALAQGASAAGAGVTGAMSAAVPAVGAAVRATRGVLSRSAEKTVAQALGATKEAMKDTAAKVAPGMLERGVKGSREAMLEQASAKVSEVGKAINDEIAAVASTGQLVSTETVRGAISAARESLMAAPMGGAARPIPGTEAVIRRLNKLDEFVAQMGPDMPFEDAAKLKTVWDRIVSKGGLYGQKVGASATDNANAWATREAASAFRKLLAEGSPNLDALNKEYAFWKGVKTVLTETQRRTQSQGGGLVSAVGGVAGATAGMASGDSMGDKFTQALVYGAAGRQLIKVMQSPAFRTRVSAPMKDALARALASGKVGDVLHATARISSTIPATAGAR